MSSGQFVGRGEIDETIRLQRLETERWRWDEDTCRRYIEHVYSTVRSMEEFYLLLDVDRTSGLYDVPQV